MDINKAFSGNYIRADDLAEGETLLLTIKHVSKEKVSDEEKYVVYFLEATQGLVLNKTNATTIAGLYTSETDNWGGKKILLYVTWVDYAGKQVKGVRVRPPGPAQSAAPRGAQPPPPPASPDQQPWMSAKAPPPPPPPDREFWIPFENGVRKATETEIRGLMREGKGPSKVCPVDGSGGWQEPAAFQLTDPF